MVEYRVPNMTLIPQDMNNACWFASARMLLHWANRFRDPFAMEDPIYHSDLDRLHCANNGLPWAQMVQFAQTLGLIPVPPLTRTPTPQAIWDLLVHFGPLWVDGVPLDDRNNVAGVGHVIVIAGIRTRPAQELLIYDPWPPGHGRIRWIPFSALTLVLLRQLGNPALPVSILHLPARAP